MQDEEGVVPGIDVLHHERRQLILPSAGTPVEKDISTRLQQRYKLGQHPIVLRQVLNDSHDNNCVVFPIRLIGQ